MYKRRIDSNTTNVKVKPLEPEQIEYDINDSNTTNVKVKQPCKIVTLAIQRNSNTTNVKVKRVARGRFSGRSGTFKYNQC